ncbi:SDR family NAD(P)-dependent oxidoreductase [Mesobaculum littorinae]|uniref:SDR family NAD(P)-dependent oxidoreductase n=1 Tax=Mesobaculum littorinae TaxID=2486419 RepID=A0A438ADI2_9RHOB|nr:SDR family NAD(P)-dependent oxidoreductase [Mesobaculum littorinae]RVV96751.1 SDR family NAD(P)-dependent oxidoreductase [Mesobaculum littorinae]
MPTDRTLVIGASGGIGGALMAALRQRGSDATGLSRRDDGLEITDEASVARCLGALEGTFDAILLATGALSPGAGRPEKSLAEMDAERLAQSYAVNAIGPALVLKHGLRLLPRERRTVVAALSARVGSIGDNRLGGWHSYRASKAALNQIVHGAAIELRRTHPYAICVALHPGTVATDFTAAYPDHDKTTPDDAAARLLDVLDGLSAKDTGGFYDYAGRPIPW